MKRKILLFIIPLFFAVFFQTAYSETADEIDRRAEEAYEKKEFNRAITLWLNILDTDPENERIQKKIEVIYEIKQKKDIALQKSKLNYKISKKTYKENLKLGKSSADSAIENFIIAYRIDPGDPEMSGMREDLKRLDEEIKAELEKERLSEELKKRYLFLLDKGRKEMGEEKFEDALKSWDEILSFYPKDSEAIEGRRRSKLAIDNRLKFEKIKSFLVKGKELYLETKYLQARLEFTQVLSIDPDNREARDFMEQIDDKLQEKRLKEQRLQQAEDFYQAGLLDIKNNRFDQAQESFSSALAMIDNYRDSKARIAAIPGLKKEFLERQRLERLQRVVFEFQNGMLAFSETRYRDAISAFEKTLQLDPKNTLAKRYIERAKDAQRQVEEESVDEFSPYYNIVKSLAVSGKRLFEQGNFSESRKKWDKILELFPKNRQAIEYALKCDLKMNPEAFKSFAQRIVSDGKEQIRKKEFADALKKFELIKSISANYPEIDALIAQSKGGAARRDTALSQAEILEIERRYQSAVNLIQTGTRQNTQRALEDLRWVTAKDPNNVKALIALNKVESQLRIGEGPIDAGAKRKLTQAQQQLVLKYYYSGINYYSGNDFKKAIEEWRKVLAIDPDHVQAKNNIRKTLAFLGR